MYAWVVILIIVAIAIAILLRYCGNTSNGFVRAYNSVVQGTSVQTVRAIYNRAREADPFIAGEILRYFAPQATKAAIVSYTAAINDLQNHEDYNYRIDNIRDYGDEMHHLIVGDIEVLRAKIRKHRERRLKDQKKDNKIEDHITHPIRPQSVHDSSAVNMVAATVDALNHKPVRNTAARNTKPIGRQTRARLVNARSHRDIRHTYRPVRKKRNRHPHCDLGTVTYTRECRKSRQHTGSHPSGAVRLGARRHRGVCNGSRNQYHIGPGWR